MDLGPMQLRATDSWPGCSAGSRFSRSSQPPGLAPGPRRLPGGIAPLRRRSALRPSAIRQPLSPSSPQLHSNFTPTSHRLHTGFILASYWLHTGFILASYRVHSSFTPASHRVRSNFTPVYSNFAPALLSLASGHLEKLRFQGHPTIETHYLDRVDRLCVAASLIPNPRKRQFSRCPSL